MINHVRTLLLNLAPLPGAFWRRPGEEYIPADFKPRVLPASLAAVYRDIFGDAKRPVKLVRTQQLLTLVHAGDLAGFVYRHDRRITYDLICKKNVPVFLTESEEAALPPLSAICDAVHSELFDGVPLRLNEFWQHRGVDDRLAALTLAFVEKINALSVGEILTLA